MALTKVTYVDYDEQNPITAQNLNDIQDNIINTTSYITCSTNANVAAKTAQLSSFSLIVGATVRVKFTNTNTASNPTLNVNNTGAKPIYANTGSPVGTTPDTAWAAGEIVELVYDGTNWVRPAGAMGSVGSLADLQTTAKSTIVDAINEVNAETKVIDKLNSVVVVTPSFSSLPQTFTDQQLTFENGNHITPDLIASRYDYSLGDATAKKGEWTVSTEVEGQITISGDIDGSTSLKIWMRHKDVSPPSSGAETSYIGVHGIVKLELTDITSLPVTFTGLTGVTAQHEALVENYGVITPKSSANGDWSFACGDGSVTIDGTFLGNTPTTVKLTLCIPDNKVVKSAS